MSEAPAANTNVPEILAFSDVQAAVMRCMNMHPPSGADLQLHPDASRLVDLFGRMSYEKLGAVRAVDVDPRILAVYARWGKK